MMLVLRILFLIFVSRAATLDHSDTKNPNNYGPYSIKWYDYVACRGPRSKNATVMSATLVTDDYGTVVHYNSTFIVPAKIKEIKIVVWNVNGAQKNTLWNYKVNKPCQHFALAPLLENFFQNKNCLAKPGIYVFKANYTAIAHQFLGESFFYGDYSFKVIVLSKQENVFCIMVNALFSKTVI